jgi:CheY-like chemotaxis protein
MIGSEEDYVLVVDDDQDIRDSLADLLADEGHQVRVASNGREALDVLRASPRPCLILLDLMMPVMDGQEFLQEKDGDSLLCEIPVCVVTAGPPLTANASIVSCVRKPINVPKLLGIIGRHC